MVTCSDILDGRVTRIADSKDDRLGCRARDRTDIMRDTEHGPVVRNSAEVGILRIGELAFRDELLAYDGIRAGLEGSAFGRRSEIGRTV